jgi:hypothetical protein
MSVRVCVTVNEYTARLADSTEIVSVGTLSRSQIMPSVCGNSPL